MSCMNQNRMQMGARSFPQSAAGCNRRPPMPNRDHMCGCNGTTQRASVSNTRSVVREERCGCGQTEQQVNRPCSDRSSDRSCPDRKCSDRSSDKSCSDRKCSDRTSDRLCSDRHEFCRANNGKASLDHVDHMGPAMGYVPWQPWEEIYDMEKGLYRGTIFCNLDKPFKGGCA